MICLYIKLQSVPLLFQNNCSRNIENMLYNKVVHFDRRDMLHAYGISSICSAYQWPLTFKRLTC